MVAATNTNGNTYSNSQYFQHILTVKLTFNVYLILTKTIANSIGRHTTISARIGGANIVDYHAIRFA